jgi:hypothetical protein
MMEPYHCLSQQTVLRDQGTDKFLMLEACVQSSELLLEKIALGRIIYK